MVGLMTLFLVTYIPVTSFRFFLGVYPALYNALLHVRDFEVIIGVWRGVSKGVEDGRRLPALQAGHP
jgi:hypothetical protein